VTNVNLGKLPPKWGINFLLITPLAKETIQNNQDIKLKQLLDNDDSAKKDNIVEPLIIQNG
jgi:hypothetical protein